jgi:HD-like signal output (HDOD) protein
MNKASMPTINLRKILAGAQLPALPQSAIRLLELSQDPDNGPAEFAAPIESDPGLTGQVLRFVNSSYFGFAREISNVKSAITLVGIRTIKNFALWSAVFSLMPNPRCGPFELKSLWTDSLRRALFARAIGSHLGMKEAEDSFTAALLQDMSVPLLSKEAPEAYAKLLKARDDGRVRLSDLERDAFGWTHAEAAGMMARQWNLPETFVSLIEQHLEIERWLSEANPDPAKVAVALSALLPVTPDTRWTECEQFEQCYQRALPSGQPAIPEMLAQVDDLFTEFAPILKLAKPKKSLVEAYQEVVAPAS